MQQPNAASTSANSTPTPNAGGVGSETLLPLRACNTFNCKVSSIVEKTKRKCSQFVSAPYIMPKPLMVNGTTSIFQVGGEMAKTGDIPSLSTSNGGEGGGQPIYRIKPGTHAHIINYILIDEGSDSMEKAKSGDPETMRMLLETQREMAISKLQKVINSHRGGTTAATTSTSTSDSAPPTPVTPVRNAHVTTPQIHPDFSIASVEGAVPFTNPVTLPAPPSVPAPPPPQPPAPKPTAVPDCSVERLQAEIAELQRTVARLVGESER